MRPADNSSERSRWAQRRSPSPADLPHGNSGNRQFYAYNPAGIFQVLDEDAPFVLLHNRLTGAQAQMVSGRERLKRRTYSRLGTHNPIGDLQHGGVSTMFGD